jgi:hypothetical protein
MHCKRVNKYNEENGIDAPDHFTVEEVHEHIDDAKYVFPPSGKKRKVWSHDHNAPRTKAYYERNPKESYKHCYWWHHRMQPDDVEAAVSGEHDHRRDVKDYSNSLAKRLDIHPRALKRLAKAEVVYFVIEGCLKADAVLSAIERDDRSESVFSVPSLTLWDAGKNASELRNFAQGHLRGKTVIIIPDADWVDNDLIISQARLAELFLRDRCVRLRRFGRVLFRRRLFRRGLAARDQLFNLFG